MKTRLFSLLLFALIAFNLCAQSDQSKKGLLTFEKTRIISFNPMQEMPKMAWYSENKNARVDTDVRYNNESSLFLTSTNENMADVLFYMINRDIIGKTIVFKGKYKYQQANQAKARFSIKLDTHYRKVEKQTIDVVCNGDQEWTDFCVEMPFERSDKFFLQILCEGEIKLWVNDCQVLVDGQSLDIIKNSDVEVDKDLEFVGNSGISIGDVNQQTLENLEVLGKVWGFLKYFHPQVVIGKYNWDFELFRVMPEIATAKSQKERNSLLNKWVDKYGEIKETEDYTVKDSSLYHRFAQLAWLEDLALFDKVLSKKLVKIKNAKRNCVLNYYLPILAGKEEVEFARDKPYPGISWEDQGYRILTVYRLWNAIQYGYPYTNLTDHKWDTLLVQYLPEFINAPSEAELDRSIQKLSAEINDSHGRLEFPNNPSLFGLPVELTQTKDGKLVVQTTLVQGIDRGMVILAVNDKSISEIVENNRSIIPSSNEKGLLRNTAFRLFVTPESELKIKAEYQGQPRECVIPMQSFVWMEAKGRKKPTDYGLNAKDILYINAGETSMQDAEQMMKTRINAKGLILDMRKYPTWEIKGMLEKYLYPKLTPFVWFTMNSKKYPGNFFLDIYGNVGTTQENPDYFKGKIAILVSETTQSQGELSSIAFRRAPHSAVIGTQTAGANGHIGYLYLPRGIKFNYTMAGVFYPGWKLNQRDGVSIDIPVEQTVKDVETGEDVWIKKGIEYIESE